MFGTPTTEACVVLPTSISSSAPPSSVPRARTAMSTTGTGRETMLPETRGAHFLRCHVVSSGLSLPACQDLR